MIYSGDSIYKICSKNIKAGHHTFNVRGEYIPVEIVIVEHDTIYNSETYIGDSTPDNEMVILKCAGNLIINSNGVISTSTRKKGLVIYAGGKFINNGVITMSGRGACAPGQNVYLYGDEFVPAIGGLAATRSKYGSYGPYYDKSGGNGTNRGTGAGGNGGAFSGYGSIGSAGTSFSGGSGGGGLCRCSKITTACDGSPNGGKGGKGAIINQYYTCSAGGGAGNPGGAGHSYNTSADNGMNGAGGLLVIYVNDFQNNGTISANGLNGGAGYRASGGGSGGGSINIFYKIASGNGVCTANGGMRGEATRSRDEKTYGGNGGNGTVTYLKIKKQDGYKCVLRDSHKTMSFYNGMLKELPYNITKEQILEYGMSDTNMALEKTIDEVNENLTFLKALNGAMLYTLVPHDKTIYAAPKSIKTNNNMTSIKITPVMTSNVSPVPYKVIASNNFDQCDTYMAFDGNEHTTWMCEGHIGWIMIDLGQMEQANKMIIKSGKSSGIPSDSTLKDFKVLGGSSANGPFVELLNVTNAPALVVGASKEYQLSNTDFYRFYKIEFTSNNGNPVYTSVGNIELFNEVEVFIKTLMYYNGAYYNSDGNIVHGHTLYDFMKNGVDGKFDIFKNAPKGYQIHICTNSFDEIICTVGDSNGSVLDNMDDNCEVVTVSALDEQPDGSSLIYEAIPMPQFLYGCNSRLCDRFKTFTLDAVGKDVLFLLTFDDKDWYGYTNNDLVKIQDFSKDAMLYGIPPDSLASLPSSIFEKYTDSLNQFRLGIIILAKDSYIDSVLATGIEKDSYESTLDGDEYLSNISINKDNIELNLKFLKDGNYIINY